MNFGPIFAVVMIVIAVVVGTFLFPTVKELLDGVIATQGGSWYNEVQAAVGLFAVFFLICIGLTAAMAIWGKK